VPTELESSRVGPLLRGVLLLGCWAAALAAGEWLALRAAGWIWAVPAIREAQPGSLPFYGVAFVEVLAVNLLFPRLTRTPWIPTVWSAIGLVALLGALASNALGGALLTGRTPVLHAPASWLELASSGLLCPFVEEWIFRGVLWQLASDSFAGLRPGLRGLIAGAFTSVAFALWHLPFGGETPLTSQLKFGAFLAVARWALGGAGPGVLVHALGNSFHLLTG
jgi:membrane protease YdiL (CAAX protease family)